MAKLIFRILLLLLLPQLTQEISYPPNIFEYVHQLCQAKNLDTELVCKMIKVESGWNPKIISRQTDYGLMQIQYRTARDINPHITRMELLNPYKNVEIGIEYLSLLYTIIGDMEKAVVAYNIGLNNPNLKNYKKTCYYKLIFG